MRTSIISTVLGIGTVEAANLSNLDTISLYVFNLPLIVIIMAAAGAMLSFAYDDDDGKRTNYTKKKVVFLVIANTFLAVSAVCVLPAMFNWNWYSIKLQGSLALLMAASARFVIPLAIKTLPEILRKWFKLGEYRVNKQEVEETPNEAK